MSNITPYMINLSKQNIYDKICTHLAAQKKPSIAGINCAYRGDGNTSCSIGCLIPDHRYDTSMENKSVEFLIGLNYLKFNKDVSVSFLMNLQEAHDVSSDHFKLKKAMINIADRYGLIAGAEQEITEWNGFIKS